MFAVCSVAVWCPGGLLADSAVIANHVTIPMVSAPSTVSSAPSLAPPLLVYPYPPSPVGIINLPLPFPALYYALYVSM